MMKIIAVVLLLSFSQTYAGSKLHFNHMGDIVKPDFEQVRLGLIDAKKGKHEAAKKRYLAAAKFGNYYAITLIAVQYINQKDYVQALAWLQLIDLSRTQQKNEIADTIELLEQKLNPEEIHSANQLTNELITTYGHEAAFKYREKWRSKLEFTGTRTRGRVPQNLTIVLEAQGKLDGSSSITVPGHEIEAQLNNFVHEYDFDIPVGEVSLEPLEMIEE